MATGAVLIGLVVKWSALRTTRAVGTPQLWIDSMKLADSTTSNVEHLPGAVRDLVMTNSCRKPGESAPIHGIGSLTEKWHALQTR